MKVAVPLMLLIFSLVSCKKSETPLPVAEYPSYTIEGYIWSARKDGPVANVSIGISPINWPQRGDDSCITDSTGYFRFTHTPKTTKGKLGIYVTPLNWGCVIDDPILVPDMDAHKSYKLGKVYSRFH